VLIRDLEPGSPL